MPRGRKKPSEFLHSLLLLLTAGIAPGTPAPQASGPVFATDSTDKILIFTPCLSLFLIEQTMIDFKIAGCHEKSLEVAGNELRTSKSWADNITIRPPSQLKIEEGIWKFCFVNFRLLKQLFLKILRSSKHFRASYNKPLSSAGRRHLLCVKSVRLFGYCGASWLAPLLQDQGVVGSTSSSASSFLAETYSI